MKPKMPDQWRMKSDELTLDGALQAVQQAKAAAEGWADNIVASRASAIDTAKAASEHAQVIFSWGIMNTWIMKVPRDMLSRRSIWMTKFYKACAAQGCLPLCWECLQDPGPECELLHGCLSNIATARVKIPQPTVSSILMQCLKSPCNNSWIEFSL